MVKTSVVFAREVLQVFQEVFKYYEKDYTDMEQIKLDMKNHHADCRYAMIPVYEYYYSLDDENLVQKFIDLGLDSEIVKPSYVVILGGLEKKIQSAMKDDPDVSHHKDNYQFLLTLKDKIKLYNNYDTTKVRLNRKGEICNANRIY